MMKIKHSNSKYVSIKVIGISILISLWVSCKKDNSNTEVNLGYTYFPVRVGEELIYDVDSVYHDPFFGTTSYVHYQIREVVDSVFNDNQGRPTMRIERYRNDSSASFPNWIIYNVWTANRTATTAERFENNIRYVKLIFPVQQGKTWDGNSMNVYDEQDYELTYAHQPEAINSLSFDSVAMVTQINDTAYNILFPKYEFEKFATGVGLIHKYQRQLDYTVNPQTGQLDTSRFLLYEERLVSFKK